MWELVECSEKRRKKNSVTFSVRRYIVNSETQPGNFKHMNYYMHIITYNTDSNNAPFRQLNIYCW